MDIKEMAKTMTREEFMKGIEFYESGWGIHDFYGKGSNSSDCCPNAYGLINKCGDCRDCWENAIKDIKFKGEDIIEDKEYTIQELFNFEEETEFVTSDIFEDVVKIKNKIFYVLDASKKWHSDIISFEWINIKFKLKKPKVDWSKVEVDTKILVRDFEDKEWNKRYFCKYENGKVYSFSNGTTSWSSVEGIVDWKYAKLYEEN